MRLHARELRHMLFKCLNVVMDVLNGLGTLRTADELANFFIFDLGN